MATGTLMPLPRFTGWDLNGDPISGGQLWTYIAGTTTPVPTYTDVALTMPHTNPITLNAAGRASSGGTECGVYLTPGTSYKFVLTNAGGAVVWTQDNVSAVPTSQQTVDVIGTAGEALPANSAVYLSSGAGGKTAGQWFLTNATFPYASTLATITGVAVAAIPLAAQGSIRTQGTVQFPSTALTPGALYYASTTAGAIVSAAPANARNIGQALDLTTLLLGTYPDTTLFARTDVANTFTNPLQTISASSNPRFNFIETSQPADARVFRIVNGSQTFIVQAINDALTTVLASPLVLNRQGDAAILRDVYEKARNTPMGHWISVPFNASNFYTDVGSWTASSTSYSNLYTLIGKTLIWNLFVTGTLAGPPNYLYLSTPVQTVINTAQTIGYVLNAGNHQIVAVGSAASGQVTCFKVNPITGYLVGAITLAFSLVLPIP